MSFKSYFKGIRDKSEDLFSSYNRFGSYQPVVVKRAELIKPYLYGMDARRLDTQVEKHIMDSQEINKMYSRAFSGMRKVNREQFIKDTQEFYKEHFPKELTNDIFNLHHKRSEKLFYEGRNVENQFRYKILDKILDPVNRMIAENSNVKSMIMTRAMVQYFSMLMAYQKQIDPENFENMKNQMKCGKPQGGNGDGDDEQEQDGDQDPQDQSNQQSNNKQSGNGKSSGNEMSAEDILEKLSKDKRLNQLQEEITNDAKETISGLSEVMDDQEQEEMWEGAEDEETNFDKASILELVNEFNKMQMNMNSVSTVIKKLLDKSMSYFHGKEDVIYENIFEASSIADIMDYHLLHPKLRKIFADDIMVRDSRIIGKIDIYIDCSGSMGSIVKNDDKNGVYISGMDFAKSFAIKLIQMGLVNKIYPFENSVHAEIKPTAVRVSTLHANGGTTINNVIKHVEKEGRNALIITDAEDRCNTYSPNAFFIGILGCQYSSFDPEVLAKYADKAQMVEFDGNKIHQINEKGKRIK